MPTAWSEWLPAVLLECAGVSDPLGEQEIRQAAIDFCARSWCYVVDQGPLVVSRSINVIGWEPPLTTQITRALQVWLAKQPLLPKTAAELSTLYGDYMQAEGTPVFFMQENPSELIIVPKPTSAIAGGITAKVAVQPKRTATSIETKIADRHYEAILHGAKARLMAMAGRPWANLQLAGAYSQRFEQDITKARNEIQRGLSGARRRVPAQFL